MDFKALKKELENLKQPKFRFTQIFRAVFCDLVENFEEITVLPKDLREALGTKFKISSLKLKTLKESHDKKVRKALFELEVASSATRLHGETKNQIESVLIVSKKRNTVCVSSQVGCPMGCLFCATGQMGFARNLSAQEIYDQVLWFARFLWRSRTEEVVAKQKMMRPSGHGAESRRSRDEASEAESLSDNFHAGGNWSGSACDHLEVRRVTNIVFMGMGEPFLNYDNVMAAIRILNDKDGFNLARRRMSISTCGIIPGIKKFMEENLEVNLGISLHAPTDELRSKLMPINRRYPLKNLMDVCRDYVERSRRKLFFEYIMISGVNDSLDQARQLAELMTHPLFHVNLIPYNFTPTPKILVRGRAGTRYKPSDDKTINAFENELRKHDISCTYRRSAGGEIWAGCGQLKLKV